MMAKKLNTKAKYVVDSLTKVAEKLGLRIESQIVKARRDSQYSWRSSKAGVAVSLYDKKLFLGTCMLGNEKTYIFKTEIWKNETFEKYSKITLVLN